jgi:CHAT domain
MSSADRLGRALANVAEELTDGHLPDDAVVGRVDAIRPTASQLATGMGDRRVVDAFLSKWMEDIALDPDPMRVGAIATLAGQVAGWLSSGEATAVALTAATRLLRLGAYRDALRLLDRALRDDSLSDEVLTAACLQLACWHHLGEHSEVDAKWASIAGATLRAGSASAAAWTTYHAAQSARALRRLRVADDLARDTIALLERRPVPTSTGSLSLVPAVPLAWLYKTRGEIALESNDASRAFAFYEQGRNDALSRGDGRLAAWCLSEIGYAWHRIGEYARGAKVLDVAAAEADAAGDAEASERWRQDGSAIASPRLATSLLARLGALRALLATPQTAASTLTVVALAAVEDAKRDQPQLECSARMLLAESYRRQGSLAQAAAAGRSAVACADRRAQGWQAVQSRIGLATMLVQAGHLTEGEHVAEEAVRQGESLRSQSAASEFRQAIGAGLASAFEILLLLASESLVNSRGESRKPDAERVLALGQRARTRTFNEWLALMNEALAQGASQLRNAVGELIVADTCVEAAASSGLPLGAPMGRRERASAKLRELRGPSGKTRQIDLDELRSQVPADAVLLDLNAIESEIICTAVGAEAKPEVFVIPWPRAERARWTESWLQSLGREIRAHAPAGANRLAWRTPVELGPPSVNSRTMSQACDELYERLFRPIVSRLSALPPRVVFAPHAELFALPFWVATTGNSRTAISCIPSVSSLVLLRERPPVTGLDAIKIADPSFSLPFVTRELDDLATYREVEARPSILRAALRTARMVHFAGHGYFDRDKPYESGILLRGDPEPPYSISSRFPGCALVCIPGIMRDFDLPNCELIVLSACSTGMPRSHAASEFTSVPAALFARGARHVIAASWPTHDAATALFIQEFYRALNQGEGHARALLVARTLLRGLSRAEAVAWLGRESESLIPAGAHPFDAPIFTDSFQHYGVDSTT